MWLQAVDSKEPCFVVYDPMVIYSDYRFVISDEEQKLLNIPRTRRTVSCVAIVPEDYKKTTINLRCPIIINTNERRAAQVILTEHYEFKAPVYEEV